MYKHIQQLHTNTMASLKPPFTHETATKKVKAAQDIWNTQYESTFYLLSYVPSLTDYV